MSRRGRYSASMYTAAIYCRCALMSNRLRADVQPAQPTSRGVPLVYAWTAAGDAPVDRNSGAPRRQPRPQPTGTRQRRVRVACASPFKSRHACSCSRCSRWGITARLAGPVWLKQAGRSAHRCQKCALRACTGACTESRQDRQRRRRLQHYE